MMAIFNFFGSILGYLLWFLYNIFHNYGVAIIFFTIIIKAVLFPFSVKSQRSMASQTKLADKQKELQAKYGNNKQKYNEEHHITPKTIVKEVKSSLMITGKAKPEKDIAMKDIPEEIEKLKALMKVASSQLDFERAIEIREMINELRKRMR